MTNQPRLCLRTTIQFETGDAELLYQTENLSASGVLVRATPSLPVGTRAALRLELPRELGPIEAFGMVVRHTDVRVERIAGFAIQFIELDQNDRARLEEFLDQQRTQ